MRKLYHAVRFLDGIHIFLIAEMFKTANNKANMSVSSTNKPYSRKGYVMTRDKKEDPGNSNASGFSKRFNS